MERLTERNPGWLGEEFWVSAREPDEGEIDEVYERLKYYEDLAEAGRLIVLPEGFDGERMLDMIAEETCPSDFGLEDLETCIDYSGEVQQKCKDCWKAALKGVEHD